MVLVIIRSNKSILYKYKSVRIPGIGFGVKVYTCTGVGISVFHPILELVSVCDVDIS